MVMDLHKANGQNRSRTGWELTGLMPTPAEEWDRLHGFLDLETADIEAMLATVEPLFQRGHQLVVDNYDYLLQNHETAAILGWEQGADPEHLAERRRFFTVWLARTLGLDLSHDFASYLFRAGQKHAGHGPRQIHVPAVYVTGAVSLVHATFARFLNEEMPGSAVVPTALAGWNKMLSLHLHMMLMGYQAARAWDGGDFTVTLSLFGRMREMAGHEKMRMGLPNGGRMEAVLTKFFNYFPQVRDDVFDVTWLEGERVDEHGTPWLTVEKAYQAKPGWRVLLNGRELIYSGGLEKEVSPGDTISIFPPGR